MTTKVMAIVNITITTIWLVIEPTPLKNDGVRQLG